jgi:hypothetical protein
MLICSDFVEVGNKIIKDDVDLGVVFTTHGERIQGQLSYHPEKRKRDPIYTVSLPQFYILCSTMTPSRGGGLDFDSCVGKLG